jgi:hypothetical protein
MAMQNSTERSNFMAAGSYNALIKEVGSSARELIESELNLFIIELRLVGDQVRQHMTQLYIFGSLMMVSLMAFTAFLILLGGEMFGGNYWLSSLIVSAVYAVIGWPLAYTYYRKIYREDLKMPHTVAAFRKEIETVLKKVEDLRSTVKGEQHESR